VEATEDAETNCKHRPSSRRQSVCPACVRPNTGRRKGSNAKGLWQGGRDSNPRGISASTRNRCISNPSSWNPDGTWRGSPFQPEVQLQRHRRRHWLAAEEARGEVGLVEHGSDRPGELRVVARDQLPTTDRAVRPGPGCTARPPGRSGHRGSSTIQLPRPAIPPPACPSRSVPRSLRSSRNRCPGRSCGSRARARTGPIETRFPLPPPPG